MRKTCDLMQLKLVIPLIDRPLILASVNNEAMRGNVPSPKNNPNTSNTLCFPKMKEMHLLLLQLFCYFDIKY